MADNTSHPCPNHLIHQHTFPELGIGTGGGSNQQPYFRAMVFFNKKPGLTDGFFHEHWKSVHADLTMQVDDVGVELVRYVQFHQERKDIEAMAPLLEASGGTMSIALYDGAAEFHARSAEAFVRFVKNVYGSSHLVGCGTRFVDLVKGYHVMVGYDNLIYGAGIPGMGKDGIMPGDSRLNYKKVDTEGKGEKGCERTDSGTEEVSRTA
ncbi:hypothetical protein EK21DRAFT_87656 [Setomelanomma holmii]|uniref:EthD domain-containing protein n=1 Tax=Setomelanomma holmii TaxID=210430 RepID=A0A9P4LLR7_9PLEO|nr:hypothetical protein EK21DRAFT_87656 [Setomelanomma holmii]